MFTNYYGQTKEQYEKCRELINTSNHKAVLLVTVLSILINGILVLVSLFFNRMDSFKECYMIVLVLLSVFALALRFNDYLKKNVTLQLYLLISIELLYGALLSLTVPAQKGTAFPVFLVMIPMLFIDRQVRMSVFLLIMCIIYGATVVTYKVSIEAAYDVFSSITFGGVSVLSHYFFNVKMMRGLVNEQNMQVAIVSYKKVQEQLKVKAETDHLTGLYNRETFVDFAKKYINETKASNGTLVVGILDVDHFKRINDSLGHQAGDVIICQVSQVLKNVLRRNDLIGRLGGDEYIFILNDIQDKEIVKRIAERVLTGLNRAEAMGGIRVEASIGITMTDQKQYRFDELYNRADIALYKAKELGRNQYCFYEDYMFIN